MLKRKSFKKLCLLFLFSLMAVPAIADIPNLLGYDRKRLHFGFLLGYNQMLFDVKLDPNRPVSDTVYGINSYYAPGFNVGIIADLRLFEYANLRFNPGLSFSQKTIEYDLKMGDAMPEIRKRQIESVYLDVPLELKIRSKRWNEVRPYVLTGIIYSFDLASLRKPQNNINEEDDYAKANPHNFAYTVGVGSDFYLSYFKFAVELKMSFGLSNLFVDESNIYTSRIERITSRLFSFTVTFE